MQNGPQVSIDDIKLHGHKVASVNMAPGHREIAGNLQVTMEDIYSSNHCPATRASGEKKNHKLQKAAVYRDILNMTF
jgi:hypothetical protein